MTILDNIIAQKRKEVALKAFLFPVSYFEKAPLFERNTVAVAEKLRNGNFGIIAEHKRKSPSKGLIGGNSTVDEIVKTYGENGAAGISILTDGHFFGGSPEDLVLARAVTETPLLRKEFIIGEYQIVEAKALGADFILLIAAVLNENKLKALTGFAHSLQLEVLIEIHNDSELGKTVLAAPDLIGVNNRNLSTFETNIEISKTLSSKIPDHFVKISESGIDQPETVKELMAYGFKGFLIGEAFMKTAQPGNALAGFMKSLS